MSSHYCQLFECPEWLSALVKSITLRFSIQALYWHNYFLYNYIFEFHYFRNFKFLKEYVMENSRPERYIYFHFSFITVVNSYLIRFFAFKTIQSLHMSSFKTKADFINSENAALPTPSFVKLTERRKNEILTN